MWRRKRDDESFRRIRSVKCVYVCVYLSFCCLLGVGGALRVENDLACLRERKKEKIKERD